MAGLQLPRPHRARAEVLRLDYGAMALNGGMSPAPMVRPRVAAGVKRALPGRRPWSDGILVWRWLAIGASALIIGAGAALAVQVLGSAGPHSPLPARAPVGAAALRAPLSAAPLPVRPAASAQGPAQGPAGTQARPVRPEVKVASVAPGIPLAPLDLSAPETGPTAADLARPAFLEPLPGDADADPDAPDLAALGPVPHPPPRPDDIPAAGRGEETGSIGRQGRITRDINLRTGPRTRAGVIATLDRGTRITVHSCKSWCEVSAGGKRGYVYRRAVAR